MVRLNAEILISNEANKAKIKFISVNELKINNSWKNRTDTATIKFPRNLKLRNYNITELLKQGDKVSIRLGYDDDLIEEFLGYITGIKADIPLEIQCEDEMWKLKQTTYKKSWSSIKLSELLDYIYSGQKNIIGDAELGPFYINNESAAKVLQRLLDDYTIYSFFRNEVLVVGKVYTLTDINNLKYHFQKNVVSKDLYYRKQEDTKIKVEAQSRLSNNTKLTIIKGDDDGDTKTLHYYNLSKKELETRAEEELKSVKYDGYTGKLTGFGYPIVMAADRVTLYDDNFKDREGTYIVEGVQKIFGVNGYRREITLGYKAN